MIKGNFYLSQAQMQVNAKEFYEYMLSDFNIYAISAMLGNIETESTINPGIWEGLKPNNSKGFGLVQWTPATKLFDWLDNKGLPHDSSVGQMDRIIYEKNKQGVQWLNTSKYPYSFQEFANWIRPETQTIEDCVKMLADMFLRNYERPATIPQPQRGVQAWKWYQFLNDIVPNPDPTPDPEPEPPEPEPEPYEIKYLRLEWGNMVIAIQTDKSKILPASKCLIFNSFIKYKDTYFWNAGRNIYKKILK